MIKKYNDWLNESAFVNEEMVVFSYILHAYASDLIVDFEQIDTSYKDYFNNKSAGEFELKDIQEFFNVKPADIIVILGEGVPENVMNAFEDMIYLDGEGIAEDVTLVKLKRFNIDLLTDEIGQYIFIKKNDIEIVTEIL